MLRPLSLEHLEGTGTPRHTTEPCNNARGSSARTQTPTSRVSSVWRVSAKRVWLEKASMQGTWIHEQRRYSFSATPLRPAVNFGADQSSQHTLRHRSASSQLNLGLPPLPKAHYPRPPWNTASKAQSDGISCFSPMVNARPFLTCLGKSLESEA